MEKLTGAWMITTDNKLVYKSVKETWKPQKTDNNHIIDIDNDQNMDMIQSIMVGYDNIQDNQDGINI